MPNTKRDRQRAARIAKSEAMRLSLKRQQRVKTARLIGALVVFLLIAGVLVSVLSGDDDQTTDAADTSSTTLPGETTTTLANPDLAAEVLERDAPKPEAPPKDLAKTALNIETLIEGEGTGAAAGDTIVVHYIGVNSKGIEFDSSWERGEPIPVAGIGAANVIAGWNEGLIGAKVGERRRLEIGSDKAYGAQGGGDPNLLPPNEALVFEIDIVDIQPAATG